jgi:predicted MFS family arabinose efflux permease
MVFFVDFVARGLGQGIETGAHYWVLYGLGAVVGPLAAGRLADTVGFGPALRLAYLLQGIATALPAVPADTGWLILSSLVVGVFTPGIVPLVLGRAQELAAPDPEVQRAVWSRATTAFALGQAAAAYGFSCLLAETGGAYGVMFGLGAGALGLALALDLTASIAGPGATCAPQSRRARAVRSRPAPPGISE